ncbi:hypothetical protein Ahy_A09g046344 [Arachis hypogaea]|uniref:HAT C-terminal dimerisation domain-containing protein n=1 Tax=Arachis hypogaea TaxID=3818 RepID=A0A445BPM9_ARAHY|nr:hypothetical protein Ahy_A09g046344 [Arachis hypogaea]
MARDILAIPVSTVASESAFSMGGRIIDQYRSSLTPKMVEALVCTEDWLKEDFFSSLAPENFEELEKVEQDLILSEDITCSIKEILYSLDGDIGVNNYSSCNVIFCGWNLHRFFGLGENFHC